MAYIETSYNPLNIIAGDADIRAQSATFLGGTYAKNASFSAHTALPALTPLKRDATTKKLIPATAITDTIIGLSIPSMGSVDPASLAPATTVDPKLAGGLADTLASAAADATISYYTHADIFAKSVDPIRGVTVDQIYWGYFTATPASDLEKQSCFDKSGINLKFPTAGAN